MIIQARIRTAHLLIGIASQFVAMTAYAGIASSPMFVSTSATPNIMLLFDNSGSMNNIIWASGYNPATQYEDWSRDWDSGNANVFLSSLSGSGCSNGYKRGRNPPDSGSGTNKCLRLPDPVGGGNTRYHGNYLNYLFARYPDNTDLTQGQITVSYRIKTAKDVASNFVNSNANLRIGLASFNPASGATGGNAFNNQGGRINAACGAPTSSLLSTINGFSANSNTPLAETFYEITRYFRGLSGYFHANTSHISPIQYRCQRNFVIVVTDGAPTFDRSFPVNDPDDPRQLGKSLPNWDGLNPAPPAQFSDGANAAGDAEGDTYYLDDLAKFAFDVDMKTSGTDLAGGSFNDPIFAIQNLRTYTVGFTVSNQMLQDAALYGDGRYFTADNDAQLDAALRAVLSDIQTRTSSAASVATNSTRLNADTLIYQARFSTNDWSGQLLAFPISIDGNASTPSWDAKDLILEHDRRNIVTSSGNGGVRFFYDDLSDAQKVALRLKSNGSSGDDAYGVAVVNFLRGSNSDEAPNGFDFRPRSSRLGDIINSDPIFVGRQDFGFDALPGNEGSTYLGYRNSSRYQSRAAMLYVGANDGMLHGFNAQTGVERFAYVPDAVIPNLRFLTEASKADDPDNAGLSATGYNQKHRYYVDGSIRVTDAFLSLGGSNEWRSILVGALGAGGQAVFALDVSDPDALGSNTPLWEFTRSSPGGAEMGFSMAQPSIGRMNDGRWAALIANGYESASNTARLYILNLATGTVIREFDTGVGSAAQPNGLSTPIPVDVDRDRIVDFIYAGDLHGNLWKFDVTSSDASQWNFGFRQGNTPKPLFTACTNAGSAADCYNTRQPITARPEVGNNPSGGQMVYFGTGKYFENCDNRSTTNGAAVNCSSSGAATQAVQSFYAIRDLHTKDSTGTATPVGMGRTTTTKLLQQTVLGTQSVGGSDFNEEVRITTSNAMTNDHNGWYIDLPTGGERQVAMPLLRGGRIVFTTLIPDSDPCGFGGDSWLMELDAISGSRLTVSPFDINNDRLFTIEDFVLVTLPNGTQVKVPVSGRKSKEGIIKTPSVITAGGIEYKFASGTTGGIDRTVENAGHAGGRQTWRQIR